MNYLKKLQQSKLRFFGVTDKKEQSDLTLCSFCSLNKFLRIMIWEIYCLTKVIVEVCFFPLSSSIGEVKVSLFPDMVKFKEPPS